MSSKRRYKIDESTAVYHEHFDNLRMSSPILNAGAGMPNVHSICLGDRREIEGQILELKGMPDGDNPGFYFKGKEWELASIPGTEEALAEIEKEWKRYKQKRINEGHPIPDTMPAKLEDKNYRLQARLDVFMEELNEVQKRLKLLDSTIDATKKSKMLKNGIRCTGHLLGGILAEIDGQKVSRTPKGVLFINEPQSPYHGLAVTEYRKLADGVFQWRKDTYKKEMNKFKQGQREKPPKPNSKGPLPPVPKDATNYAAK